MFWSLLLIEMYSLCHVRAFHIDFDMTESEAIWYSQK